MDSYLLVVIAGLAIAGIGWRIVDMKLMAMVVGGLIAGYGGSCYGYLKVVTLYPNWLANNPSLDPWEGALWLVGGVIGAIVAVAIAIGIGWPVRHLNP